MQANLGLVFERKANISCNGGRSVSKNLRARKDCMRTSRKTDFRQKNDTSARLKITFVDMTYPGQRPELPSLSRHFLLVPPRRRRRTYVPTSNTASHDDHEKINSWVSLFFLYGYGAVPGGLWGRRSSSLN